MKDIRLYLAGQRADLSDDPKILFNYTVTDTTKPTAIKNSFTKSINLPGTQNNNAIFGDIWDLSRLQFYSSASLGGSDFNPLKKSPFELYVDGEIYETGYFKLTNVTKNLNKITYSITLYGGLGEFIYNLTYGDDGNKLEFKDLAIPYPYSLGETGGTRADLSFTVSKDTIKSAWDNVDDEGSVHSILNFALTYNGLPEDFDCNKVLINLQNAPNRLSNLTTITSYQSWSTGECEREMTPYEARDIRSYLTRPVIRVKSLIGACCNSENNGGYGVALDEHFFNNDNPYYQEAWMTLPMIKDMNGIDTEEIRDITGATITRGDRMDSARYYNVNTNTDFSELNDMEIMLGIKMTPDETGVTANTLYLCAKQKYNVNNVWTDRYVKYYNYYSSILIQLVAYDEIENVVATSDAYQLTSGFYNELAASGYYDWTDLSGEMDSKAVNIPAWHTLLGKLQKSGSTYVWCDNDGVPQTLKFSFNSSVKFHHLKFRVQRPYRQQYLRTFTSKEAVYTEPRGSENVYPYTSVTRSGYYTPSEARSYKAVPVSQSFEIEEFKACAVNYGSFLSGRYIAHDNILTLGVTPADFLISYCKLFGLHLWKEKDKNIIHIDDRNTYYRTGDTVNLQDLIDRSKDMKITPQVASAKWYDFNTEQIESEVNNEYLSKYGYEYGLHRVNTGYEFDSGITKVYEGIFKGGVDVLESSPYFYKNYEPTGLTSENWPVYMYLGFKYTRYSSTGKHDGSTSDVNSVKYNTALPLNDEYAGFDIFRKPQFHTEDNDPSDGAFVLLFKNGSTTGMSQDYWITDDLDKMASLNDKTPCYIYTSGATDAQGNTIAVRPGEVPIFSRNIIYQDSSAITLSWDFGKTLETYIPETTLSTGNTIYERCWKAYTDDMYDVNSRILNCYVVFKDNVTQDWLRKFYWFDNGFWVLNKIKEYNPQANSSTNVEFIKVQDRLDYTLHKIDTEPIIQFYLADYEPVSSSTVGNTKINYYEVGSDVTSVTSYVEVSDGGTWSFREEYEVQYSGSTTEYYQIQTLTNGVTGGTGNTNVSLNIGANTDSRSRIFRISMRAGVNRCDVYITQAGA